VAAAGVVGAICGNGADVFVVRDLVQQVWQDRAVAFPTGGEVDGLDVGCGRVHGQMDLAPLASALDAMFPGLPLAIAEELMPVLSTSRLSGPPERRYGICTFIGFCLRQGVE
jgi:hypothetical protein